MNASYAARLEKLPPARGGYFYVAVAQDLARQFGQDRSIRVRCRLNDQLELAVGLNPLGNGDYFIIIATRHVKSLGLTVGDELQVDLSPETDPLGVPIPEVLEAYLEQEPAAAQAFASFTPGKKRTLIYGVQRYKSIDRQLDFLATFFENGGLPPRRRL